MLYFKPKNFIDFEGTDLHVRKDCRRKLIFDYPQKRKPVKDLKYTIRKKWRELKRKLRYKD